MNYCILRTDKLSTFGNITGSSEHNFRERVTENADPKRTPLNKTAGAQNTAEVITGVKARLKTVKTVRKNAVLAVEYFIGASPEWFTTALEKQREAYFDDAEKWLKQRHGAENVIAFTRQYDETSPHVCAYVVPIDPRGKLNCSFFQDGRAKLQALQTEFAAKVGEKYGLQRGIEGSTAKHGTIKDYYCVVNEPTPQPRTIVPKVPERTFSEQVKESLGGTTVHSKAAAAAELAKKKRQAEIKAQREAEQAKAKQYEVLKREMKDQSAALASLRATSVQLRHIQLDLVMERFGAIPDPADIHNWITPCGRVTVNGTKFFNHDTGKVGDGGIYLAMHLEQCDYKAAVNMLAAKFGTGAVLSQAIITVKDTIEAIAAEPAPPFVPPSPAPENWPIVRDYLHHVRKISLHLLEDLKNRGQLNADRFKNCVFFLADGLGAELHGTGEKPFHWIRGEKAGLLLIGKEKKVAIVEYAIDALSLRDLGKFGGSILATCGNAASNVKHWANAWRQEGYEVVAAQGNDGPGDAQAAALGDVQRLRPVLKDWNADLVASKSSPPKPVHVQKPKPPAPISYEGPSPP